MIFRGHLGHTKLSFMCKKYNSGLNFGKAKIQKLPGSMNTRKGRRFNFGL